MIRPRRFVTLLAFALFLAPAGCAEDPAPPPAPASDARRAADARPRIEVDADTIGELEHEFSRRWGRPPTAAERDGLIAGRVREEVLYREALHMGLDRTDPVVRRHLANRIETLLEDLGNAEPSDAELQAQLDAEPERYAVPPRLSFDHRYVSVDRRGDAAEAHAHALLAALRGETAAGDLDLDGDALMISPQHVAVTPFDVERVFGRAFSEAVFALEPGTWEGPIPSGYGLHLIRVAERVEAFLPPLEQVRERVKADVVNRMRSEAFELNFERMRDRYDVVIAERDAESANP